MIMPSRVTLIPLASPFSTVRHRPTFVSTLHAPRRLIHPAVTVTTLFVESGYFGSNEPAAHTEPRFTPRASTAGQFEVPMRAAALAKGIGMVRIPPRVVWESGPNWGSRNVVSDAHAASVDKLRGGTGHATLFAPGSVVWHWTEYDVDTFALKMLFTKEMFGVGVEPLPVN